jgi:16S rRNA (guanine1207-N2)-methyltransferase
MTAGGNDGVYGLPPDGLIAAAPGATQFSPLLPGAASLEAQEAATLSTMTMLAPSGSLERRRVLALALNALTPDGRLSVLAPKDKGGARLGDELRQFGCAATETAKRHHRICICDRPPVVAGFDDALNEGAARWVESIGLWSQPGVFSWNRIDPGSALLAENLPPLSGRGADFGCGIGYLSKVALASSKVAQLALIDIDRRAIEAARRNIDDPRARFVWADARQKDAWVSSLDFVVMNPPFHDSGAEDKSLGQSFIARGAEALRTGGVLWLTANRHLPYEAVMKPLFKRVTLKIETGGYKIFEARK